MSVENLNSRREKRSSVILSTINLTQIGLRSEPGLFGGTSLTKRMTHYTDF